MTEILNRILDHTIERISANYIPSPFGETKRTVIGWVRKPNDGNAQNYPSIVIHELPGIQKRFPEEIQLRFQYVISTNSIEQSRQIAHRLFQAIGEEYDFEIVSMESGKPNLHCIQFAPIDTPTDIGISKGIFDYAFNYQFLGA